MITHMNSKKQNKNCTHAGPVIGDILNLSNLTPADSAQNTQGLKPN